MVIMAEGLSKGGTSFELVGTMFVDICRRFCPSFFAFVQAVDSFLTGRNLNWDCKV